MAIISEFALVLDCWEVPHTEILSIRCEELQTRRIECYEDFHVVIVTGMLHSSFRLLVWAQDLNDEDNYSLRCGVKVHSGSPWVFYTLAYIVLLRCSPQRLERLLLSLPDDSLDKKLLSSRPLMMAPPTSVILTA